MANFELSQAPSYMNKYVAALLFLPHTDIQLFQEIKASLATRRGIQP